MSMTLLQIVQEFTQRTNLNVPNTVYGSSDAQVLQMLGILQEGCIDLSSRGPWQDLISEATWVTTATEDQGAITTLASGYRYMLPRTLWDRTQKIPLWGPTTPQTWQMYKAIVITGPQYSFRIRNGKLIVTPAPPAGHTWAFEYVRRTWIQKASDLTFVARFTADADVVLLPEDVVLADLRWRWNREKRLSYAEEFLASERLVVDALGREPLPIIRMDGERWEPKPGIFVPSGSWNLP